MDIYYNFQVLSTPDAIYIQKNIYIWYIVWEKSVMEKS